jgi:hypothetical protein
MSLDPSQLSLPQIAAAVAAGELPLAAAEAELKRRPAADASRWKRFVPPSPVGHPPGAAEILRALGETRRELLRATRQLGVLASRLEALERLAAPLQPVVRPAAAAASESQGPRRRQRKLRLERTPVADLSLPGPVSAREPESAPLAPSRTAAA